MPSIGHGGAWGCPSGLTCRSVRGGVGGGLV